MTANEVYQTFIDNQAEWMDDSYHVNRFNSAHAMQNVGRGNWVYVTQWSSGSCLYSSPVTTTRNITCIVRADGTISA